MSRLFHAAPLLVALGFGCARTTTPGPVSTQTRAGETEATASKSVGELRAAMSRARADGHFSELAALVSALEARGAMTPREITTLIDRLSAAELGPFAEGAAKDGTTSKLAARRVSALDKHRNKPVAPSAAVAVLLPLSGPHATIGVELRAAIEMAAKDLGVGIAVVDTKGTEEGARAAVELAAHKHKAGAILGPVGERESIAAARAAASAGIAIGLLSPAESGASPSAGVYRLWPSRQSQAATAAAIAVRLGYDAPAVLAPRDEIGWSVAKAFTDAATRAGASSVRAGFYDPGGSELEPDLKAFLGLVPLHNERLRRHLRRYGRKKGWKSFSPDIDFDLLYIPDTYDRAALVASYLPFYNVELRADEIVDTLSLRRKHGGRIPSVVQLLGSHEWNHRSLIARGGAAVDGALIAETCVGGSGIDYLDEESALLARRLRRALGRQPSRLASQGYDVARMVLERFRKSRRADRTLFELAKSTTPGACGPMEIDASGQLRREPVLLRVEADELVLHEW